MQTTSETVSRQAWLALGVATLVSFLVVVDVSVVNVAFPTIRADLGASETSLSWIVSGYNIGVAAFLLLGGRLADSLGRKKVFLPGVALFMIGSLLCGMAPNAGFLIAARVVQAIGGAVLMPASLALVLPEFPLARRSTAVGFWGATGSLGAAFGPSLGSVLIRLGSWRYVFLINVPLCLLVLVLARRIFRESRNPDASGRIDLLGIPIGTAGVALGMLAIVQSEQWGIANARVLALSVAAVGLIALLIVRSKRHPEPLLDLSLYRHRSFASSNLAVAFYSMGFTSGFLLNSLLLQNLWDQSILQTGAALTPSPLLATATSIVGGRYADRYGHRWLIGIGSALLALTPVLYLLTLSSTPQVWDRFVPISLIAGLGTGMSISSWFSAAVSDVGQARFGVANATLRTIMQVFYGAGVSVAITLLATADGIDGFRHGWVWVAVMMALSTVVVLATFPAGSSTHRAVAATD
ncbi:MAG: MFS transporter [Acidimicrobiales bacterium]|nr:MFS transporter [Acidimicrobiales bacterium]